MTVPTTMRAARIHAFGGPEQLVVEEVDVPQVGDHEVLVEVHAASVNGADLELRRTGFDGYFEPPLTLGVDLSGVVVAVGPQVERLSVGDAVHGRRSSADRGTYSAYAAVPEDDLVRKPKALSHVVASAVPVVGLAAWQALYDVGHLSRGERALIHGAGGGVGHLAVQFAQHFGGYVVASDTGAALERARALGPSESYDFREVDVLAEIWPVELVVDPVGGPVTNASLGVLGSGGRLVTLVGDPDVAAARSRGANAISLDSWMDRDALTRIDQLIEAGEVVVDIAEVLPLSEARRAHELAETGEVRGKLVLDPRQ